MYVQNLCALSHQFDKFLTITRKRSLDFDKNVNRLCSFIKNKPRITPRLKC